MSPSSTRRAVGREIVFRAELELLATRMPNLKLGFIPEAASTASPGRASPAASTVRSCSFSRPDFLAAKPFCCGPDPFMKAVSGLLRSEGSTWATITGKLRSCANPNLPLRGRCRQSRQRGGCTEGLTIDFLSTGEHVTCEPNDTVLKAARSAPGSHPAACESGMCGTCKVKKRSGEVEMHHNGGITTGEIDEGYILACCSRPLSALEIEA